MTPPSVPPSAGVRHALDRVIDSPLGARLWRHAPLMAQRNSELLRSLYGVAFEEDLNAKLRELQKSVLLLVGKMLDGEVASARELAVGYSERLLGSQEFQALQLSMVPHLGVLQSLAIVPRSRLEYVLLLLGHLHAVKKCHPQLGLGSGSGVVIDGDELSGLDLAQCWALVANAGHLFGTFATEGALLRRVRADRVLRDELLDQIDQTLRTRCAERIDEGSMHRFFYVLAAWRVSRWTGAQSKVAVAALQAYLDRPEKLVRLRWVYSRARQLAYDRMHYYSGLGGLSTALVRTNVNRIVESLIDRNGLEFHEHSTEGNQLVALLDAHDRYQQWAFFTSPSAARLVRQHTSEFQAWWYGRRNEHSETIEQVLPALFSRPDDWPTIREASQHRFLRIELPGVEGDWLARTEQWEATVAAGDRQWQVFVSPTPGAEGLLCDIYDDGELDCRAVLEIARSLASSARNGAGAPGHQARKVWRSCARFGARLLEAALKPGFEVLLESVRATDQRVGYCVLAETPVEAVRRARDFLRVVGSDRRRRELEAVASRLDGQIAGRDLSEGPLLVFLASVKILETETQHVHRELDGVWAEVLPDGLRWHVLEHKSGRGTGRGQLGKLPGVLRAVCPEPVEVEVDSGTASYVEFRWPPVQATAEDLELLHRRADDAEPAFGWSAVGPAESGRPVSR